MYSSRRLDNFRVVALLGMLIVNFVKLIVCLEQSVELGISLDLRIADVNEGIAVAHSALLC